MRELHTLGRLTLVGGDRLLVGRRRVLALLAFLVRRDGRRVSRDTLAAMFWPEVDEQRSRQSLRTALTELRAAVGDAIQSDAEEVGVDRGAIVIDVAQMAADIARANYSSAVGWWHGEFLTGLEEFGSEDWRVWLEAERAAAGKQIDWAFDHLVAELEQAGRWSDVVTTAERWVAARPANEKAASRLISALRTLGRLSDASARHAALTSNLRDATGVDPSAAFKALALGLSPDVSPGPGVRGLLSPELVGREDSLTLLNDAWARTRARSGVCVLVEGDDGTGKTRLVDDFSRACRGAKDGFVAHARVFGAEHDREFSALKPVLDQLADAPGLAAVPAPSLGALGRVSGAIRERFPAAGAASSERIADAFVRALGEVAFETPLLVVIDDAALADTVSLEAIEAVVRRPPPGVLIVLTARPEASNAWPSLAELRNAAHVASTVLGPLTRTQTRRLVEGVGPVDPEIIAPLSDKLFDETGGRPGAIVLLVRQLAEIGLIAPDATGRWTLSSPVSTLRLPVPAGLADSVRSRLTGLDDDARRVLECAAVIGPRVDATALETVVALPADRYRAAFAQVLTRRHLRNSAAADRRLEFAGESDRRAVYEQIVPSARRAMHRSAARALRLAAVDESERAVAREHERLAGPRALRRPLILAAAVVVAVVVVLAMRRVTAPPAEMSEGTQVLLANVQNLTSDSSLGPALDLATRVGLQRSSQVRLFPASQIRESIARMRRPVAPAGLDERLAQEVAIRENLPAFIHLAVASVDSAFVITGRIVEPNQSRDLFATDVRANGRADILPSLDVVLTRLRAALGESRFAMRNQAALPLVTTSSLDALRYYVVGNAAWTEGRRLEAKNAWMRAIELDSSFALVLQSMGLYYYFLGDSGIDRAKGDSYFDRALAHKDRLTERERLALDASVASQRGAPEDAIAKMQRLAERFPERDTWANLGAVLMRNRRLDEAAVALRHAIALDSMTGSTWINLATVHSIAGRLDSALYAYDRAAALGTEWLVRGGNVNQEWGAALLRVGRVAAAESLYRRATMAGDASERSLGFRSLGWLAMYRGRYREATGLLEQAVALSTSQSGGLSTARNGWLLATAYLELGDTVRARSELTRAEAALGTLATAPVYISYLARAHLRAGNNRAAARLRTRVEQAARDVNTVDRSSLAFLNGLIALGETRHDSAIVWARRGNAVDRETNFPDEILARAYEGAGSADSALAAAKRLEGHWQFGFEAQQAWRHAGLRVARLSLKAGDTTQARAALDRQLAVWKDADVDFPDLVETRRLRARLTTR